MSSTLICLVSNQYRVESLVFAGPWIPTLKRKPRDAHPRRSFQSRFGPPLVHARFPRYFTLSEPQKNLPLSTLLTGTLQLDSSYEAATPSRLDLVLRQRGFSQAQLLIQKSFGIVFAALAILRW